MCEGKPHASQLVTPWWQNDMMEVLDACGCQSLHTVNGTVLLLSFTTTAHRLKMVPFEWEQKDLMVSGLLVCGL